MAETRSQAIGMYLIGDPMDNFSGIMLPTTGEVLRVYFHHHNKEKLSQKDSVKCVVQKVLTIWEKARVPTSETRNIVRKMETLVEKYRNICRNKNRGGAAQVTKESEFIELTNHLFDIAHQEALNMLNIHEDKLFLVDQRSNRKYVMGGMDRTLARKEKRKLMRTKAENALKAEEEIRKRKATSIATTMASDVGTTDESDTESDEDFDDQDYLCRIQPSTSGTRKRTKLNAATTISPGIAAALDRTNVSDRKAAYLLSEAARTYGEQDVSKLPLSVSSIYRSRTKHRAEHAVNLKTDFSHDGSLVVHFDGKLLPCISGGPTKEDRVAILVSGCKVEKLLGVPKIPQGTGEQVSQKAVDTITDWNVQEQLVGMSFDTTSANTGRINGACVLLEKKLDKNLLWLACRHHVLEVVCGDVFRTLFGPTSGPNVLLFRRFQEYWPRIDQTTYEACCDVRLDGDLKNMKIKVVDFVTNILEREADFIPREDYRELLELTLIFLGKVPPRYNRPNRSNCGIHFRVPGTFHHARWMSKLIYVLKICIFSGQFKLTAKEKDLCLEFGLFVVLIYVKAWMSCTNSCDAPMNDLLLIQDLTTYKTTSQIISKAGIAAISRHLWYLGEEMTPIALFSDIVSVEIKRLMVASLKENSSKDRNYRSVSYKGKEDLSKKALNTFIGPASHFFFDVLKFDISFFDEDVEKWEELQSYQNAKLIAKSLKVVNDGAERAIALATTFNSSITKKEEQKQYLFQVIESHRKRFPDAKKKTLTSETEK
jgi:hypothetical protein